VRRKANVCGVGSQWKAHGRRKDLGGYKVLITANLILGSGFDISSQVAKWDMVVRSWHALTYSKLRNYRYVTNNIYYSL
jgi:hypothetical protein